jgi:hypothetical protein
MMPSVGTFADLGLPRARQRPRETPADQPPAHPYRSIGMLASIPIDPRRCAMPNPSGSTQ